MGGWGAQYVSTSSKLPAITFYVFGLYLNETDNSPIKWMGDNELCHHNNKFTQGPISRFICQLVGCTAAIHLAFGAAVLSNESELLESCYPRGFKEGCRRQVAALKLL